MPTSKSRLGNALNSGASPVPAGIAAVIATTLCSRRIDSAVASANTFVYCGALGAAEPVADTPCHFWLSSSAGP